jgi:thioredoxin
VELERIARSRAGRLLVAQAELRGAPESARRFGVTRAPTVVDARGAEAIAAEEDVAPEGLEAHARFLLGEGPKPAPQVRGPSHDEPAAEPITVTDDTFGQVVLKANRPVLVDFWAPWCGPCKMTNPMVERLAREQAGKLQVAKVNVDENPGVAGRYEIQSIPTMMLFKGGAVVDRWMGAIPEGALRSRVAAALS